MARDRGVRGDYVDRAFYGTDSRMPAGNARSAFKERQAKAQSRREASGLLRAMQASRPLKPPGMAPMPKRDPKRLAWIRTLPCVFQGDACEGSTEGHHRTGAGLALKAPDDEAMPLCQLHHRQRHDHTGAFLKLTKAERKTWEAEMVAKYQKLYEETR